MDCCICQDKIGIEVGGWAKGHNASPIVEGGRCCEACNSNLVIPVRMSFITPKMNERQKKEQWGRSLLDHQPEDPHCGCADCTS